MTLYFPRAPSFNLAMKLKGITDALYAMELPFVIKDPIIEDLEEEFEEYHEEFKPFAEVLRKISADKVKYETQLKRNKCQQQKLTAVQFLLFTICVFQLRLPFVQLIDIKIFHDFLTDFEQYKSESNSLAETIDSINPVAEELLDGLDQLL